MPTDPLEALRLPDVPVAPDPVFRDRLERRLVAAAGRAPDSERGTVMFQPPDSHTVSPYLAVDDARRAIEWYRDVFDARVTYEPIVMDDGRVGHAEVTIGDSAVMLADEFPEIGLLGPNARGGPSFSLNVFVPDVDATFARSVEAGATVVDEPSDQFHGSRRATVIDPFGHRWMVSTWLGESPDA